MGCWETPVFNSSQVAWNLNLKFHSTGTVVYGSRVLPDNQAPSNRGWAELEFFATEWVAWWEKCQGTPFYILPMYLLRGARVLIQWYHTRWGIWITNKWYTFIQLSLCQIYPRVVVRYFTVPKNWVHGQSPTAILTSLLCTAVLGNRPLKKWLQAEQLRSATTHSNSC